MQLCTVFEINALFTIDNVADAEGKLEGMNVIDNSEGTIASVEIYATSGGTLTVTNLVAE